jgi:hypothetical protein
MTLRVGTLVDSDHHNNDLDRAHQRFQSLTLRKLHISTKKAHNNIKPILSIRGKIFMDGYSHNMISTLTKYLKTLNTYHLILSLLANMIISHPVANTARRSRKV